MVELNGDDLKVTNPGAFGWRSDHHSVEAGQIDCRIHTVDIESGSPCPFRGEPDVNNYVRISMKLPRRKFLHLAAALPRSRPFRASLGASYPTRPVRILLALRPAAGSISRARLIGQWLSERLGQQFIIENRLGAVPISRPKRSCARRRTATRCSSSMRRTPSNATLYDNLNYNFLRDILRSGALFGSRWSWWSTRRCRQGPSQSSSPSPRPMQARLNVGSGGPGARTMRRRAVQDHDRRRHDSCAVSRIGAGARRSHRRPVQWWFATVRRRSSNLRPAGCARWP